AARLTFSPARPTDCFAIVYPVRAFNLLTHPPPARRDAPFPVHRPILWDTAPCPADGTRPRLPAASCVVSRRQAHYSSPARAVDQASRRTPRTHCPKCARDLLS